MPTIKQYKDTSYYPSLNGKIYHGVYYINRLGQLNFKHFGVDDFEIYEDLIDGQTYQTINITLRVVIPEDYLIVGLMLDNKLIDVFKESGQAYAWLKPIELYLMRSSNISFEVPMTEYRTANIPLVVQFDGLLKFT